MLDRPYMSLSALELVALFEKAKDSESLKNLQHELMHRRTKPAKKLLIEVNKKLGVTPGEEVGSSKLKFEHIQLKKRYDSLRRTFTVEGEILARWGMTSAMPEALEEIIFDIWSKSVTADDDEFGRTSAQLAIDMEKLKNERRGTCLSVSADLKSGKIVT